MSTQNHTSTPVASGEKSEAVNTIGHGLSLRANTMWYLLGNLAYSAAQWCMVVLVARLGNVEAVGVFALAFAVTAPIVMFANLRLRFVQASDARNENEFREYLALRLLTTLIAFVVIGIVVAILYGGSRTSLVALTIGLAKSFEAVSDVYYGRLQRHQRMDWIAVSLVTKAVLSVGLFGGILYATRDLIYACGGLAVAWGLVLVALDSRCSVFRGSRGSQAPTERPQDIWSALACFRSPESALRLTTLAKTAMPLGVVAFLVSLSANIPRYVIHWESGERALGFYSAISYIMAAGVTVLSSLGQSAVPRLAHLYVGCEYRQFVTLLIRMLAIAAAAGIIGIVLAAVLGKEILLALYGGEYGDSGDLFTMIMVAASLNYLALLLWYALTAMRAFRVQFPLFVGDVLLTTVLSVILVPRMGATGGALAVTCVMGYHVMLCAFLIARQIRAVRMQ